MTKRRYRKSSMVERSALAGVNGTVRHTPTSAASAGAKLTRAERKALADKLTSAERRAYSVTMQERAQVKALTSRQAREIERQEIAEFQALNSAQSATTRGKRKHTMFAANIMASLRGDNKPESHAAYNVSKRFILINSGQRDTLTLLRAPAIVHVEHDGKGEVLSKTVITPVRYAVMRESATGEVDVIDVDNGRAFNETIAAHALSQESVMSAVAEFKAFQDNVPVESVDPQNMDVSAEHLRFALDVVMYGKRDALQRARLRKLRSDTRELESTANLLDLQVAHAAKLTLRNELERKALETARKALTDQSVDTGGDQLAEQIAERRAERDTSAEHAAKDANGKSKRARSRKSAEQSAEQAQA